MPVRRRRGPVPNRRAARLPEAVAAAFFGRDYFELPGALEAWFATDAMADAADGNGVGEMAALWRAHEEKLVAAWVSAHPGTRPDAWWCWSVPRGPDGHPERRRRLSGEGVPAPHAGFDRGVPADWSETSTSDGPAFESEATFLARHGLLLPGERQRLAAADFDPEPVELEDPTP